jgi:hypothetical protein
MHGGTDWVCSFSDGICLVLSFQDPPPVIKPLSSSISLSVSLRVRARVCAPPPPLCVCVHTRVRALVGVWGCVCPSVTAQLHDFIAERLAALVRRAGTSAAVSAGAQNGLGSLGGGGSTRDSLPVGVVVEPVAKHASLHGYSHADLDLVGTVTVLQQHGAVGCGTVAVLQYRMSAHF